MSDNFGTMSMEFKDLLSGHEKSTHTPAGIKQNTHAEPMMTASDEDIINSIINGDAEEE